MTTTPTLIEIEVRGVPRPQPRAKTQVIRLPGKRAFARVYTPRSIDEWKEGVTRSVYLHRPTTPWQGPVRLELRFYLPRPARLRTAAPGAILASSRSAGDNDNLAKAVMDVLESCGFVADDAQFNPTYVEKWYAAADSAPGVRIRIGPVEPFGPSLLFAGAD
ncbi:MAG: RusA family crossover junction endodeoxyribonuclease [Phycisphaeraceae bacterium]|nr:RusA family crossover junction endodeoxyribonuclease [Phycisphaeraceae bacterium]